MKEFKAVEKNELVTEHPEFVDALEHIEECSQNDYSDTTHFLTSTIDHVIEDAIEYGEDELTEQLVDFQRFLSTHNINLIFWNI